MRFVAVGDAGELTDHLGRVTHAITAFCTSHPCDFGLLLGDNAYPRGIASPDDPLLDQVFTVPFSGEGGPKLPFYAVLGNHDYGDSTEESHAAAEIAWAGKKEGRFTMPAPAYTFTAGPVRFVGIDTTDIFWWGGADQARWIDGLPNDKRVNVLFAHHPYRSDGPHGNAGAYEGFTGIPWVSGNAIKSFYEQHVCGQFALALTGHDHLREWIDACGTSWLLSGGGAKPAKILDRGNDPRFERASAGFVWVEIGAATRVVFVNEYGQIDETSAKKR